MPQTSSGDSAGAASQASRRASSWIASSSTKKPLASPPSSRIATANMCVSDESRAWAGDGASTRIVASGRCASRSGSRKRWKGGSSDASYTERVSRCSAPRRSVDVPLVRKTHSVRAASKLRSATSLKAPAGTAGTSRQRETLSGVALRPSQ